MRGATGAAGRKGHHPEWWAVVGTAASMAEEEEGMEMGATAADSPEVRAGSEA